MLTSNGTEGKVKGEKYIVSVFTESRLWHTLSSGAQKNSTRSVRTRLPSSYKDFLFPSKLWQEVFFSSFSCSARRISKPGERNFFKVPHKRADDWTVLCLFSHTPCSHYVGTNVPVTRTIEHAEVWWQRGPTVQITQLPASHTCTLRWHVWACQTSSRPRAF